MTTVRLQRCFTAPLVVRSGGGVLGAAAPSQMEARVAPGQDLTGAAMATFLYDRLVAEEAG